MEKAMPDPSVLVWAAMEKKGDWFWRFQDDQERGTGGSGRPRDSGMHKPS